jgi:GTP pyrophosphokinase
MTQNLLEKATEYAKEYYKGKTRKNGEPFINHPLRVKKYLEEIGISDEKILAAALLHAIPQTTNIKAEELIEEFGEEVIYLISNLDEISKLTLPFHDKNKNVELIHKLLIQLAKDIRVLIIRLADRVDNVKTADALPYADQEWIALNSKLIYAPIAKAAGIYSFARELDDEAFRILNSERYKAIEEFQAEKYKEIESYLESAKQKIEDFIKTSLEEQKYDISFRKKGIYSTHSKALYKAKKGHIKDENDFNGLFDLLGLRIMIENEKDCYKILAFIQDLWENIQSEFDDYIINPKRNGYKSLQTAVKLTPSHNCEVQIRTFDMHHNNEFGKASHFVYKYGGNSATWIKDLIDLKENIQGNLSQNSKINLFEDTMFVFTPKGDLITLPKNATALDFAYAIHTNIGNTCTGALINNKHSPIATILKSGDIVEIITHSNKKPSKDWLLIAKTPEAKKHIRKSIGI